MQAIIRFSSLVALVPVLVVGCDVSTPGTQGRIEFTPDDCGRFTGCNFADAIGVGGRLSARIQGIDDANTADLELEASDPGILAVSRIGDVGGQATWELVGLAAGPVSILAVDGERQVVDSLDVSVVQPEQLTMENILGQAMGPFDDTPGYDQRWIVPTGQRTLFYAVPALADGSSIMGQYDYTLVLDPDLTAAVNDPDALALGRLDITPTMPGSYEVSYANNAGNTLSVLLDVQDLP